MFLFYCAAETDLATLGREGLWKAGEGGFPLWTSLEAAQAACRGPILVVAASAIPDVWRGDEAAEEQGAPVWTAQIPPEAFCNLDPYLPPQPVVAAGGFVVRPGAGEPEVLLIFRRGLWDLPKGKCDPGETVEACALREVREEVGVVALRLVRELGTTVHGYARDGGYHVKTTSWFLMQTPATRFTPEAREGIEAVAWTPWREAVRRIDYASLRDHMARVEDLITREMS
jgi:ADP-ribose pyrophosphatase YjhB (NUDIX family)